MQPSELAGALARIVDDVAAAKAQLVELQKRLGQVRASMNGASAHEALHPERTPASGSVQEVTTRAQEVKEAKAE